MLHTSAQHAKRFFENELAHMLVPEREFLVTLYLPLPHGVLVHNHRSCELQSSIDASTPYFETSLWVHSLAPLSAQVAIAIARLIEGRQSPPPPPSPPVAHTFGLAPLGLQPSSPQSNAERPPVPHSPFGG